MAKAGFWLLWLSLGIYAFFLAPPNQPDTLDMIINLSIGKWDGINPLIAAIFSLMGVLPVIYSCLILIDGRQQKIPAWSFSAASFGVGAFALLPYLALRQPNQEFKGEKDWFLNILDSRWLGVILTVSTIGLLGYGLAGADWADFIQQWRTNRFVNVMTIDFCLVCSLFPALVGDDMARRGLNNRFFFWMVSLIPLFGALVYLCLRPPLTPSKAMQENYS